MFSPRPPSAVVELPYFLYDPVNGDEFSRSTTDVVARLSQTTPPRSRTSHPPHPRLRSARRISKVALSTPQRARNREGVVARPVDEPRALLERRDQPLDCLRGTLAARRRVLVRRRFAFPRANSGNDSDGIAPKVASPSPLGVDGALSELRPRFTATTRRARRSTTRPSRVDPLVATQESISGAIETTLARRRVASTTGCSRSHVRHRPRPLSRRFVDSDSTTLSTFAPVQGPASPGAT